MSAIAAPDAPRVGPAQRLDGLFAELSELTGQRNAIDGRIVEIVAEIERYGIHSNLLGIKQSSHWAAPAVTPAAGQDRSTR